MGISSDRQIEMQQEQYEEEKAEWIREQLNDPDAEEYDEYGDYNEEWEVLDSDYDAIHASQDYDYDEWYTVDGKTNLELFVEVVESVARLLSIALPSPASNSILIMIHTHIISAIEAYLSSTFIEKTLSDEKYMRRLIKTDKAFSKKKYSLKEVYIEQDKLKNMLENELKKTLQTHLEGLIFHRVLDTKKLYKDVFNIDFGDTRWFVEAVDIRHDCVHRAGYNKDGEAVQLTHYGVKTLMGKAAGLVQGIEGQLDALHNTEK